MKNIPYFKRLCLFGASFYFLFFSSAFAQPLHIAVAANFAVPMRIIAQNFEQKSTHTVMISSGSTGKFYAQIKNGAPFDLFFSADDETVAKLENENATVPGSRFTYAIGTLVLWSPKEGYVDSGGEILKKPSWRHLSIASPKLAPYGKAAKETLEKLGLWELLQKRMVQGENVAQAFQFVSTGNAELGFVALSQIYRDGVIEHGSAWIVPDTYHSPIRQDAAILSRAKDNVAAAEFMAYIRSEEAKSIILSFGYAIGQDTDKTATER